MHSFTQSPKKIIQNWLQVTPKKEERYNKYIIKGHITQSCNPLLWYFSYLFKLLPPSLPNLWV